MKVKNVPCKHGTFSFYADDEYVGRSLDLYGEFSEDEACMMAALKMEGKVAVEVGSNIGALTVPLAQIVGPTGKVYAFEPQPDNYRLLVLNLRQNGIENTEAIDCAVGSYNGTAKVPELTALGHTNYGCTELNGHIATIQVPVVRLDDMEFESLWYLKIDAEGSELDVLNGAEATIAKHRPFLYVENNRPDKYRELIGWLLDHEYRCFWHRPPLFHRENFNGNKTNVFGNITSHNMACIAEEGRISVGKLPEIGDQRIDAQMHHRELKRVQRILTRVPGDLETRRIAAHCANLIGDVALSEKYIAESLAINPKDVGAQAMQGLLDLQAGRFERGWQSYELRHKQPDPASFGWRPHDKPDWDGEPTDKPVLIWSEQGFGDSIMFVRFMREVLARAPNAILEVQPQLYELFETSGVIRRGRLYRLGRTMPDYAYHCCLPSLPKTLGLKTEQKIIRERYLWADKAMIESWLKRDTPRIGICLKGGLASERAYSRDMPVEASDPITKAYGPFMSLANEGQWESYADTAAAIMSLDLVLTVDTSVAHLAGALGVETWLMLSFDPDWRWQRERGDSPWYPSMRIFRQRKFMDWSNVVDEIMEELTERTSKRVAAE